MMRLIDAIRQWFIRVVRICARRLNTWTHGRLHPNTVTICGLLLYIPIAFVVASGRHWILAGFMLLIFGLFDKLDGELARLQDKTTDNGGFLDALADRFKEVLLYVGAAYWFAVDAQPALVAWAVAACGVSLSVSYIKAKGEAIVATRGKKMSYTELNKVFADGLMLVEVRATIFFLGLMSGYLGPAIIVITILASYTALQRMMSISKVIK